MRLVMVVEEWDGIVAEPARAQEALHIEYVVDAVGPIAPQLGKHEASRVLLDATTVLLAQPANAADRSIEFGRVLATAQADHVDVPARRSDDLQHFVDCGVRMAPPVVLVSGQPLERYRRLER